MFCLLLSFSEIFFSFIPPLSLPYLSVSSLSVCLFGCLLSCFSASLTMYLSPSLPQTKQTTNPRCRTKTHVRANLGPHPGTGANEILPFLPTYGKIQCFGHLHKHFLKNCPFQIHIRTELRKNCEYLCFCPFSPDNQTGMNAPPPKQTNIFQGFLGDAHRNIS